MGVFGEYAEYYNAFYKDKDYKSEALTVDSLIKKYGEGVHSILTFGCGTGSYEFELNKLGYLVEGLDFSEEMVSIARSRAREYGMNVSFKTADIRDFRSVQKVDAVVSLFHVMSYQNTNGDVVSTIKSARNSLDKGGLFVFDAWYGPGVLTDPPSVRVKEVDCNNNRLIRIARPSMNAQDSVVCVNYEVLIIDKETRCSDRITETHKMRYFFKPEMEYYLNCNGFVLMDCVDCHTLKRTDYNSWTCFCIAKAV